MFSIRERFTRTSPPDRATSEAAELLASCNLADPEHVQRELAAIDSRIAADDAAWGRLDRTSNPHAFAEQQAIAARRPQLEAQREAKRRELASAKTRGAAVVALDEIIDVIDQQIHVGERQLYADFLVLVSKDERRARLEALDGLVRLRARLAAPLAVVCPLRKFRRAPDPFVALAHDLRARAEEIERLRAPGMPRAAVRWPAGAQELIDALKGGTA